jgi:hypothetical protein
MIIVFNYFAHLKEVIEKDFLFCQSTILERVPLTCALKAHDKLHLITYYPTYSPLKKQ